MYLLRPARGLRDARDVPSQQNKRDVNRPGVCIVVCNRSLPYTSIGTGVAYLTRRSLFVSIDLPTFDWPITATDGPTSLYLRTSIALGIDATNAQFCLLKAFFAIFDNCISLWDILRGLKPAIAWSSETSEGTQNVECQVTAASGLLIGGGVIRLSRQYYVCSHTIYEETRSVRTVRAITSWNNLSVTFWGMCQRLFWALLWIAAKMPKMLGWRVYCMWVGLLLL